METVLNLLRLVVVGAFALASLAVAALVVLWAVRDLRRGVAWDVEARLPPREKLLEPGAARKIIGRIGPAGRR